MTKKEEKKQAKTSYRLFFFFKELCNAHQGYYEILLHFKITVF